MRVLVLKSRHSDESACEDVLIARGFEVDSAATGEEASRLARTVRHDLFVLDGVTDEGLACCKEFRESQRSHDLMMIALVPLDDQDMIHRVMESGVDDMIPRSFSRDQMDAWLSLMERRIHKREQHLDAEERLHQSEAWARAILETTVDGVITIDPMGMITSFNAAAEAIFQYEASEVIGKNVKVLMPPPFVDEHDGYLQSYHDTGRRGIIGIGREVVGLRKNGETFPMDLAVSEVSQGDGSVQFTGLVRDISERRKLEQEILRISEEERRRIGQDLHDGLGQMLTGLGLITQNLYKSMAARDIPESSDVEEVSELIKEADQFARGLARGLVPVDLSESGLEAAIQRLAGNAEKLFGIKVAFEHMGTTSIQEATAATHLYRITQEAVNNAVKHGHAQHIRISLAAGARQVRLRIQDDGVGFPEELDEEKRGMGVRIMKHRARVIGASLDISRNLDGGTTITCTIRNMNRRMPEQAHEIQDG